MNSRKTTTPFKIEEIVTLHQMPSNPSAVDDKSSAIGMRAAVKIILTKLGGSVFPKPEKAPV